MRKTARIALVSVVLFSAGLAMTACQSDPDIDITKLGLETDPPEVIYNQGLANLKAGNMSEASRKFDAIDKQQLDRCFTEHFPLALEAVVRGTAEHVTLQRNQLQRRGAVGTDHGCLQFLVGIGNRGVQYAFELAAGEPRAACTDGANGYNNSQKHAC